MIRSSLLSLPIFCAAVPVVAQAPTAPPQSEAARLDACLTELLGRMPSPVPDGAPASMIAIDPAGLARHAFHLASPELGGRHTGTEGQRLAAQYIAAHFAQLGFEPLGDEEGGKTSFIQDYEVRRQYVTEGSALRIAGVLHQRGFAVLPGSKERDVDVAKGRLVYCGDGKKGAMPAKFAATDIPVVLMQRRRPLRAGMPSEMQFMMGFRELRIAASLVQRALRRGAKTALLLDIDGKLADVMQYGGLSPDKPILNYGNEMGMGAMLSGMAAPAPMIVVGRPLAETVLAALNMEIGEDRAVAQTGPATEIPAAVTIETKNEGSFAAQNVVAVLRGSDPTLAKEAVVFSAHMDHMGTRHDGEIFNGADDNASGTSALLEVAQAFAMGERPRRSVVFLAVSGEELGLWGSEHFATHPTWPLEDIVADVNIDMIGRPTELSDENQISATPSYRREEFSTIVRSAAQLAPSLGLELTNGDTYYERSDHYNFAKRGVPVVFFCDGEHEDYHQVSDTPDKLDYAKMERVARLAFWTGWSVCQADDRPQELGSGDGWLED